MSNSLGDRMKDYENAYRIYLPKRLPVIVRIDGRAFHTFTKGMQKPFDHILMGCMKLTARRLCKEISGCKLAYTQSDEISLLLTCDDTLSTEPWFGNNLQKLTSLSASLATLYFNDFYREGIQGYHLPASLWFMPQKKQDALMKRHDTYFNKVNTATFDSRAFIIPHDEVVNYFIWRQQDAVRNSVQMVAQSLYSHRELMNKNTSELQDMMMEKGVNWNNCSVPQKRGVCIVRKEIAHGDVVKHEWVIDENIPNFTQDRSYIEGVMPCSNCIGMT